MNTTAIKQLESMLDNFPDGSEEIEGVILDYIGRTGLTLHDILQRNHKIYSHFFLGENCEAGKLLIRATVQSSEDYDEILLKCDQIYPKVCTLTEEIMSDASGSLNSIHGIERDPKSYLECTDCTVIWQLSDIHFGKFNKLDNDPRQLAFMLAKIPTQFPALKPDIVIVTGDVTSVGKEAEYNSFKEFSKVLMKSLWGEVIPENYLVIPGNHDVSWQANGFADKMAAFKKAFLDSDFCISPFNTNPVKLYGDESVKVSTVDNNPDTTPPFCVVEYEKHKLFIVLLVSGYFSGAIPNSVRELLSSESASEDDLISLLRADEGSVNNEYLFNISNFAFPSGKTGFGIIHHNPIQYGIETCKNRYAPSLLKTLAQKNVNVLFHGHTHLTEQDTRRPLTPDHSYPIPCPTLCSITTAGSSRGFNIILHGRGESSVKTSCSHWHMTEAADFSRVGLFPRYLVTHKSSGLAVTHL
ncbi:MAG: metallophosphoesterase [Kiritimatiellia bacterium]